MSVETVTIDKAEYDRLCHRDLKLSCLENGGVENWDWYGEAMEELERLENGDE